MFHISKSYLDKNITPRASAGLSKSNGGGSGKGARLKSVAVQGAVGFGLGYIEAKYGMPKVVGPLTADVLAAGAIQALLWFKPAVAGKYTSLLDDASKASFVYFAGMQGNIMGGSDTKANRLGGGQTAKAMVDGKDYGTSFNVVRGEQQMGQGGLRQMTPEQAWANQFNQP